MRKTPPPDIEVLLESLLSRILHVLRERLVGLYLHGSLVAGGFNAERSDIDLLAATETNITQAEFEALRSMHLDFARENPRWADRVDIAYLSVAGLRTFRSKRSPIAIISGGEPFYMTEAGKEWLMNWYAVREGGVALFGPPPEALIAPITLEELAECVRGYVAELADSRAKSPKPGEQSYVILSMCRALYLHRTGERASKGQSALWAQEELPQWSALIQRALSWREDGRGRSDGVATGDEMARFVNFVRDQIPA